MNLPKPKIECCFVAPEVEPCLPALELTWDADAQGVGERTWHLPDGVHLRGSVPERFGITIHRTAQDAYQVRVLWNHFSMSWEQLTRTQIMASSLAVILRAVGTDLWQLLNQPIKEIPMSRAA